jgi:hypothetical protein
MSDIHPGTPRDDVDRPNLTVEDAGSTTDPADLVGEERARQGDQPFTTDSEATVGAEYADQSAASTSAAVSDSTTTSGTAVSDASATSGAADSQTAHAASYAEPVDTAPADTAPAAVPDETGASAPADDRAEGLAALAGDDSIGHVFDQTNGVIGGLDGDSDGTAESDEYSAGERGDENPDLFHDGTVDTADGGSDDTRRTGA